MTAPAPGVRPPVADLHLHTTASDGVLTPTQLIEEIAPTTLRVVAITDHDSTAGIAEAVAAAEGHGGLSVIPGLELGTEEDAAEAHLLGYFIDTEDPGLRSALGRLRRARVVAAKGTVGRLRSLGIEISWDRVRQLGSGAVGRPHIARAMTEAGYVASPADAFRRYLGDDGVARVRREKPTPVEGIRLIHAAGGACVLAHPQTVPGLPEIMGKLVDEGLDGIEVFAPKYPGLDGANAPGIAERYGLIATGGTDYHALGGPGEIRPGDAGVTGPPADVEARLRAAAGGWKRRGARPSAGAGA